MLPLQANAVDDATSRDHLQEASTRISAVGRAYERLAYNADHENIGLVSHLREVIDDLEPAVTPCKVHLEAPKEINFAADRAILVALIVNELVLNAGKYAYPSSTGGSIWVRLLRTEGNLISVSVRDEGIGCLLVLILRRASGSVLAWSMRSQSSWDRNLADRRRPAAPTLRCSFLWTPLPPVSSAA